MNKADLKRRRATAAAVMMVILSLVLVICANTFYTIHSVEQAKLQVRHESEANQRRICGVLNVSKKPRPTPPVSEGENTPITPYGRDLAIYNEAVEKYNREARAEIDRYSKEINCPEGNG